MSNLNTMEDPFREVNKELIGDRFHDTFKLNWGGTLVNGKPVPTQSSQSAGPKQPFVSPKRATFQSGGQTGRTVKVSSKAQSASYGSNPYGMGDRMAPSGFRQGRQYTEHQLPSNATYTEASHMHPAPPPFNGTVPQNGHRLQGRAPGYSRANVPLNPQQFNASNGTVELLQSVLSKNVPAKRTPPRKISYASNFGGMGGNTPSPPFNIPLRAAAVQGGTSQQQYTTSSNGKPPIQTPSQFYSPPQHSGNNIPHLHAPAYMDSPTRNRAHLLPIEGQAQISPQKSNQPPQKYGMPPPYYATDFYQ